MQQNTNPYFVMPMDLTEGIAKLGENIGTIIERKRKSNLMQEAMGYLQSGDEESFLKVASREPWISKNLAAATGVRDETERRKWAEIAKQGLIGNGMPLLDEIERRMKSGENTAEFQRIAELKKDKPEEYNKIMNRMLMLYDTDTYKKMKSGGAGTDVVKGRSSEWIDPQTKQKYNVIPFYRKSTNESWNEYIPIVKGLERTGGEYGETRGEKFGREVVTKGAKDINKAIIDLKKMDAEYNIRTKKEPQLEGAKTTAKIAAESKEKSVQKDIIQKGIDTTAYLPQMRRALYLMTNAENAVKTGGWRNWVRLFQRFTDTTLTPETPGELSNILGKKVLKDLIPTFGARPTDYEQNQLKQIEAGFTTDTATNIQLINQAIGLAERSGKIAQKSLKKRNDTERYNLIQDNIDYIYDFSKEERMDLPPEIRRLQSTPPDVPESKPIAPPLPTKTEKDEKKRLRNALDVLRGK